jgi:hypothetical protein
MKEYLNYFEIGFIFYLIIGIVFYAYIMIGTLYSVICELIKSTDREECVCHGVDIAEPITGFIIITIFSPMVIPLWGPFLITAYWDEYNDWGKLPWKVSMKDILP